VALLDLTQHPGILLMPGFVNAAFDADQAVKISGHQQRWPGSLPGAILIPPALLVVADLIITGC